MSRKSQSRKKKLAGQQNNDESKGTISEEVVPEDSTELIERDDDLLTFGQVFVKVSKLAWPMALSFTFSTMIALLTYILSNLDTDREHEDEYTAAINLITNNINTFFILALSGLFAMGIIASNRFGDLREAEAKGVSSEELAKKITYIASINPSGYLFSAVFSLPVFFALYFSESFLTNAFRQDEKVTAIAQSFLRPYSFAIFPTMSRICSEQIMFSRGYVKSAMFMGLGSLGLSTGIAAWLGFGGLGVPKLGYKGVALGYLFESTLTALLYGLFIAWHKDFRQFKFFTNCKLYSSQLIELLKLGGPIAFSMANEIGMSFVISLLAGKVGTREQAALTYVMQYVFLILIPSWAFSQVCCQEVSREVGAKKYENANRIGKYGLLSAIFSNAPIPIVLAAYPRLLIWILNRGQDNPIMYAILKYLVPIISAGVIADSARYNMLNQLRALNDSNVATAISFTCLALGMGTAGVLGLQTRMGIYGVATGYSGGISLAALLLFFRWVDRIQPNKIKEINERPPKQSSPTNCLSSLFAKKSGANSILIDVALEAENLLEPEEKERLSLRRNLYMLRSI